MLDLKPLFLDLKIKKAHNAENLHELGRLLREYREFIYPRDNKSNNTSGVGGYSPGERALLRTMNRRNSETNKGNKK